MEVLNSVGDIPKMCSFIISMFILIMTKALQYSKIRTSVNEQVDLIGQIHVYDRGIRSLCRVLQPGVASSNSMDILAQQ